MSLPNAALNFAADIPRDLADADDLLTRYGRWACDSGRKQRRCGSGERDYVPLHCWEELDHRRSPLYVALTLEQALVCQRTLAKVPDHERMVLSILYIPRRHPVELQLRLLRIAPRVCQQRHLKGLRMFDNLRRLQDIRRAA